MSSKYKFKEKEAVYFITGTVISLSGAGLLTCTSTSLNTYDK
ncbi:MAG: hypothetical protein ABIY51_04350 [Ferruginibacter sp.]